MDYHSSKNDESEKQEQAYLLVYFLLKPVLLIILKYNKNIYLMLKVAHCTTIIKDIKEHIVPPASPSVVK